MADAANWIGGILTPWVVGTVRPWNYYVETITDTPRPGERFDAEAAVITDYHQARRALLSALATAGETVPPDINHRAALASHTWPRGGTDPITQDQLLDWARATHHPAGDPPPARSAGATPGNRRKGGRKPQDPKFDQRVADAWETGLHSTHAELAKSLGRPLKDVRAALDRHRKARKRAAGS